MMSRREALKTVGLGVAACCLPGCGDRLPPAAEGLSFCDRVAIEQLLHRYCHRLDRGSAASVAALFAEDAVLVPAYERTARVLHGRAAIEAWFTTYMKASRAASRARAHRARNPLIGLAADGTVRAVSHLEATSLERAGDRPMLYEGLYEDTLDCVGGSWCFAARRISLLYCLPLAERATLWPNVDHEPTPL